MHCHSHSEIIVSRWMIFLPLSFGLYSAITVYCTILWPLDSIRASDVELLNPSTQSVGVAPCFSTCETRAPLTLSSPLPRPNNN